MFNLFKKKSSESNLSNNENSSAEDEKKDTPQPIISGNSSADVMRLGSEMERVKASIEAFAEVRKSFTERFTRTSEQIGELRSMILERDKGIQEIELKAIKAADLVESVQPEKIMTDVQKANAKIEALKANLEGNEAIMSRIMDELKEAKRKIEFFRGIEEIVKLSEETKKELIEIKKIESKININTDKVETIYAEMRTKFQDSEAVSSELQELKVGAEQAIKDIGFLKDKISGLAEKSELEKLFNKVQRYVDALKELEKESSMSKDIAKLKTLLDSLK
jgi:chromosome segregation ATPase